MTDKFDDVIDPEENVQALLEAQGKKIDEEVLILELLNGSRVKVRYLPQSMGSSLEYDDGTPIAKDTRKPKFKFSKWAKDTLPKLNDLALKNVKIINDLDGQEPGPKEIRLSLIGVGEFRKLYSLCFPGASDDSSDSEDEDNGNDRKKRKGIRGRKPDEVGA